MTVTLEPIPPDRIDAATAGRLQRAGGASMNQQLHRVLLVDDDESILESVRCALVDRGYEVLVARDGSEALARAERDAPELIVLDLVMPRRSGLTVLDRLRSGNTSSPHIIMLTANDEPRHRDFALSRGVAAFLAKPFAMEDLLTEVDAVFEEKLTAN